MTNIHSCEDCGNEDCGLVWSGYVTPLPDVAPTHQEWQELWLCENCQIEREVIKRRQAVLPF
ncbi:MAG: hypothetical protein HRJ53_00800 [Acidobacteria bacterium Pan2503]|uniref:Uncharacterized protein n=1 Tax=Candidatus Acidiferrum panamense TaxID=2741543 RepID=A0A7V8NLD4_9BACT|nr:hypothetical protein [Candidatus Acidoferrum panamensis]